MEIDKILNSYNSYRRIISELINLSKEYEIQYIVKSTLNSYSVNIKYTENLNHENFNSKNLNFVYSYNNTNINTNNNTIIINYNDLYPFICPNIIINNKHININKIYNFPAQYDNKDIIKFKKQSIILNWLNNYSNEELNLTEEILKEVSIIKQYTDIYFQVLYLKKIIDKYSNENMDYLFQYLI